MNMKRLILTITAFMLCMIFISGCSEEPEPSSAVTNQTASSQGATQMEDVERISIMCTIFPLYDWTRQIIGQENLYRFDLSFVISSGIDLHSFNPSVSDMARIKTSDAFIYIGGHSDNWVGDVMRGANPGIVRLSMMDVLVEELGDQVLLEGFCDDDCDEDHDHNFNEPHADEHVWLSLRRAKILCAAIAEMLSQIDPENAQIYRDNADAYVAKLSALDAEFHAAVAAANVTSFVIADRFPFRYMMDDYGLTAYAAFLGCSAESEASFVTIISLANRLNQLGLNVVLVTESSDQAIARTVIDNSEARNQRILVLDAAHSVTVSEAEVGVTYLSIMENNLAVLKEAME